MHACACRWQSDTYSRLYRLNQFLKQNNILSQCQTGFRKIYRTADHLQAYRAKGTPIFAGFVNFTGAYDSVWRGLCLSRTCFPVSNFLDPGFRIFPHLCSLALLLAVVIIIALGLATLLLHFHGTPFHYFCMGMAHIVHGKYSCENTYKAQ